MILIALGANLPSRFGKPEETLEEAKAELEKRGISILKSSRIYLTDPVPASDQPKYRNGVVSVKTALKPRALFYVLKSIEKEFGRDNAERNAARILDLDLLAYDNEVIRDPDLMVPHPRMHQRQFVLEPLVEVAPDWLHPLLMHTAEELFHNLPEKVSRGTEAA